LYEMRYISLSLSHTHPLPNEWVKGQSKKEERCGG
jgi:hypothetical protein